jgi:hypothetical protein
MQDQFMGDRFALFGLFEGAQDQFQGVHPCQLVRDDEAIEQILDGG